MQSINTKNWTEEKLKSKEFKKETLLAYVKQLKIVVSDKATKDMLARALMEYKNKKDKEDKEAEESDMNNASKDKDDDSGEKEDSEIENVGNSETSRNTHNTTKTRKRRLSKSGDAQSKGSSHPDLPPAKKPKAVSVGAIEGAEAGSDSEDDLRYQIEALKKEVSTLRKRQVDSQVKDEAE